MATEKKQEENKHEMEYRMLGSTGLKVSVLGFGFMTIDSKEQAMELMSTVRKYGDPCGSAEKYFGEALTELTKKDPINWRRSDLVITTKLYFGTSGGKQPNSFNRYFGENEIGCSRKHLLEGMKESLLRLNLKYVDIIYAHRFDALTPMFEIVSGFTQIINNGHALYWGTSMWPPHKIIEAYWIAKINNLIPPIVEQPEYNMFVRDIMEYHYLPLFNEPYNIGTTIWSPLHSGILTGKYSKNKENQQIEIPKDSRLSESNRLSKFWAGKQYIKDEKLNKVSELIQKIIKDDLKNFNISMTNLALGWCLKNKNVSVCILGGRKSHQLEENIGAINAAMKLNKDIMKKIDDILGNKPAGDRFNSMRPIKKIIETL